MLSIRPLEEAELSAVYRRVARDFPPIEYPPLRKMRQHLENGFVEGRLCARQSLEAAYAFLLSTPEVSSRLLLLYAVEPEMRGLGVGSAFLRSILEDFAACDGLYAEVEKPELAASSDERRKCLRRIAFYERAGFAANPHAHVHPPYRPENSGHALMVMSRPRPLTEDKYTAFAAYLAGVVMKDCQKH